MHTSGRYKNTSWIRCPIGDVFPHLSQRLFYFPLDGKRKPTGDGFRLLRDLREWVDQRPTSILVIQAYEQGRAPHTIDTVESVEEAVRVRADFRAEGSLSTVQTVDEFMAAKGYPAGSYTEDQLQDAAVL